MQRKLDLPRFVQKLSDLLAMDRRPQSDAEIIRRVGGLPRCLAEELVEECEGPLEDQIRSAIRQRCIQKAWPAELPERVLWLACERLQTCFGWIARCCSGGAHPESAWLEFPRSTDALSALEYLIGDWYVRHGRDMTAARWILQEHDKRLGE